MTSIIATLSGTPARTLSVPMEYIRTTQSPFALLFRKNHLYLYPPLVLVGTKKALANAIRRTRLRRDIPFCGKD
jgi:hypothetical protein